MKPTGSNYIKFIEELAYNAWPSYKTELYDDWLIGYSDFYTHRTNCVNVIGASKLPLSEKVAYCESDYKRLNTPSIFKINPLFHRQLDEYLSSLDYQVEHETDTYLLELRDFTSPDAPKVEVELKKDISREWITNLFRLNKTSNPSHLKLVPKMYETIPRDVLSACIRQDGVIVATGLGIIERDHMGIYAIYVDERWRRNGFAKCICTALLEKAKAQGISRAYLQVVKDNFVARQMYESLGFHYLYSYWFRVKHAEMI